MTCFVRKVSATCCVKKKKNFLMEQVTLHFLLDASRRGVLDGIKVKRSLMRQINSVTLCVEIVFFMQEIMLSFHRQNRLPFMLM